MSAMSESLRRGDADAAPQLHALVQRALIARLSQVKQLADGWRRGDSSGVFTSLATTAGEGGLAGEVLAAAVLGALQKSSFSTDPAEAANATAETVPVICALLACSRDGPVYEDVVAAAVSALQQLLTALRPLLAAERKCSGRTGLDTPASYAARALMPVPAALSRASAVLAHGGGAAAREGADAAAAELSEWARIFNWP